MELVLLHALPLDGSMWADQQELLPGRTHAPTLYGLGDTVSDWAASILDNIQGDRLLVVGNSVGGSCALEMAALAPERIAALVLIGAKAAHRPDPELRAQAISMLREQGTEAGIPFGAPCSLRPRMQKFWRAPKASRPACRRMQ